MNAPVNFRPPSILINAEDFRERLDQIADQLGPDWPDARFPIPTLFSLAYSLCDMVERAERRARLANPDDLRKAGAI